MIIDKKTSLLFLLLTTVPFPSYAIYDTVKQGLLYTVAVTGSVGFLYNLIMRKRLQKEFDGHKKRFKKQEFLGNRYDEALTTLADYKDYAETVEQKVSPEETAKQVCTLIEHQFGKSSDLIPQFKKRVHAQRQKIMQYGKEVERALIDWQNSKKRALLNVQGPLVKDTLEKAFKTLNTLTIQIPYLEGKLFMHTYADTLKDEFTLDKHLKNPAQLHYHLDKLIRNKARIGEHYPYRVYAQTIEKYYSQVALLKQNLSANSYSPFQKNVVDYITTLYRILDAVKKQIKASKEFESECLQYNAEVVAVAREKENQQLRRRIEQMNDEMSALKTDPLLAVNVPTDGPSD